MQLTQTLVTHRVVEDPPEQASPSPRPSLVPLPPESIEAAGLSDELVAGLVLKALYTRGALLGFDLFDSLALPVGLLDEVVQPLQDHRLVEVHSTKGPRRGEWVFKLTDAGRARAAEELEICRYVGPAPVPFEQFRRWTEIQAMDSTGISDQQLREVLDGLVLPDSMLELLGPAINSGRSMFLFGGPGNGKTLVAERVARLFGEQYYVPFSVLLDDSVMIVHDPVHHRGGSAGHGGHADTESSASGATDGILRSIPEHDRRFARARRPVVVTGGELTLEQLDLQWDTTRRMYQAPPQLKAAGGVLVVDDLGRQRVPVRDLLNRWVVPLEQRKDYLTLASGRTVVVPFDCFVIFSTNLKPRALGDEAFLRRIHYKVEIPNPGRDEYALIFQTCCQERGISFDESAIDYVFDEFYGRLAIEPRRCHPRDVLNHLTDVARYRNEEPCLSPALLEPACRSYFVPPDSPHVPVNGA